MLRACAVAFTWAVLNRASALFEIQPGLTFFYPAAAVTVLAGAWLRWWGVAAMLAGNFLLPWGAAETNLVHTFLFALPAAAWAAVLVALPPAAGGTWPRLRRFAVFGVIGGGLLSALLGGALLTFTVGPKTWLSFLETAGRWWIPDVVVALTFGVPLVVAARPETVMTEDEVQHWRDWWRRPSNPLSVGLLALASGAIVVVLAHLGGTRVHWFAALLLPALTMAGMRGGVGAGLVTNSFVAGIYLVSVFLATFERSAVVTELAATYGNMVLFSAFAVFGGVLGGRNLQLLAIVRRQGEELAQGLERTVEALAVAMEARNSASESHVPRVVRLAVLVGKELGLPADELAVLRRAAILHDVGRIGVPERIFSKSVELTPEEILLVRSRQVELGVEILKRVEFLNPVVSIVRYQKERWDGKQAGPYAGYYGLRGEDIPIGARILAAVIAYDAMTHDKPFRRAMSREAAVAELWRCSGTQFDPAVVAAFTRVLREEWDIAIDSMAGSDA